MTTILITTTTTTITITITTTTILIIATLLSSLEGSTNFDSYLKELGVGFILRQLAQVLISIVLSKVN